ncbi:MAG: winged helix DNA-binding protein [Candidatus Altiarchaeota archaeon]|nr:winged helix DNA-binding protein [Candidatus Altiarchaeota archaeon]
MKTHQVLENLFLRDKPAKLLLKIKDGEGDKYASILSREVDCTYSHCVRILQQMENLGLVKSSRNGRVKRISLTSLGGDIAVALENLIRILQRVKGGR